MGGESLVGDEEEEAEEEEVGLRDDVPGEHGSRIAAGKGPKEEERDEEGACDGGCEGVGSLMMGER